VNKDNGKASIKGGSRLNCTVPTPARTAVMDCPRQSREATQGRRNKS